MDDDKSGASSRHASRKEEEDLFSAIIAGYLRDKIDLKIYPNGISIKEISNPNAKEMFFPFEDEEEFG